VPEHREHQHGDRDRQRQPDRPDQKAAGRHLRRLPPDRRLRS
jgi:hypothetical protein